ncbi:MAG TPA: NAD(P)H-dependent oxidoreductase [Methanocella sp.]|nr:NAD(P)H-dependent oxidoreductase [Methanocella sp.]
MTNITNRVLILIGSPRRHTSTSYSLGSYLADRLQKRGVSVNKLHVKRAMGSKDRMDKIFAAVDASDVVVFSFPLCVDSVPSHLIAAMEKLYERYQLRESGAKKSIAAIVNSGFSDPDNNDVAIGNIKRFADLSGLRWLGSLSLCSGDVVDGKSIKDLGDSVRDIKRSLDLTADALAEGRPVPEEASELMQRPVIPSFLPTFIVARMGNAGFKKQAKENGTVNILMDRPYEKAI